MASDLPSSNSRLYANVLLKIEDFNFLLDLYEIEPGFEYTDPDVDEPCVFRYIGATDKMICSRKSECDLQSSWAMSIPNFIESYVI